MSIATEDDVIEAMKDVVDPELGINVVDLGLVYGVSVDDGNVATVNMTLTSPLTGSGCHHGGLIRSPMTARTCSGLWDLISEQLPGELAR